MAGERERGRRVDESGREVRPALFSTSMPSPAPSKAAGGRPLWPLCRSKFWQGTCAEVLVKLMSDNPADEPADGRSGSLTRAPSHFMSLSS